MNDVNFTVLIGSFARGTGASISDLDVLRVGHTDRIRRPAGIYHHTPISYVDHDTTSFFKLYNEGSLFLYHAFFEGKILSGDYAHWALLKNNFVVSDIFHDSIREYLEVLDFIDDYPEFYDSSIPYLSNIFKCLKNIGIFRLASKKQFNFEKASALEIGCGLTGSDAKTLILANAVFERSMPISNKLIEEFEESAKLWRTCLNSQIKRLSSDI